MQYWTGLAILRQVCGELGLSKPSSLVGTIDTSTDQILSLLNAAGNELVQYYPWEQFKRDFEFLTNGQPNYPVPDDWAYFTDQTQWDRTNHWPMLGPKSPQEWAWMKGGLLVTAPRVRYRVMDNKLWLWPVETTDTTLAMEYTSKGWVLNVDDTIADMVTLDDQLVRFDPWLVVKFIKLKFYQLKAFDTSGVLSDFTRIFDALTGKDVGAPILSLNPRSPTIYIGPWSVPDGSWNTGQP